MSNNSSWQVKSKRYVAYLDILGFKDYVLRHNINNVYSRIKKLNALRPDDEDSEFKSEMGKSIKFTIFSDSIFIFSKDDSFESFHHFLSYVKKVMRVAICKEIPLKGAIAYGMIIVDDKHNLFCGQPIIDAYQLEEELQYMGVVFHHTFDEVYHILSDTQKNRVSSWIKEVNTPFKYGKRIHKNLDYRISGIMTYDLARFVMKQRFYSSGDTRKYVDNTLDMLSSFK